MPVPFVCYFNMPVPFVCYLSVRDMLALHGDLHHIFPKNYLKKAGLAQNRYNQVANFVYVQQEVNIKIGDKPPTEYLGAVREQCVSGKPVYGAILNTEELQENLTENCLPLELSHYEFDNYDHFLESRRSKMAEKIRQYYFKLA